MKLQTLSTGIGLMVCGAIALAATPARAFNFTSGTSLGSCNLLVDNLSVPHFTAKLDDTTNVNTCTTADGFTLTAAQPSSSYLQGKKVDEATGVGISGPTSDFVPGEINKGELLDVVLDKASIIKSIDLSFLYRPGVFADKVFEIAGITANGSVSGKLTVTGATSATWTLGGTVINIDPSKNGQSGWYRILNPFANLSVSNLTFAAITNPNYPNVSANSFENSDYSLVGIEKVVAVPEPGTVGALLGMGVLGSLATRRRNKKSA
jgi:PEP-CTERM motif